MVLRVREQRLLHEELSTGEGNQQQQQGRSPSPVPSSSASEIHRKRTRSAGGSFQAREMPACMDLPEEKFLGVLDKMGKLEEILVGKIQKALRALVVTQLWGEREQSVLLHCLVRLNYTSLASHCFCTSQSSVIDQAISRFNVSFSLCFSLLFSHFLFLSFTRAPSPSPKTYARTCRYYPHPFSS